MYRKAGGMLIIPFLYPLTLQVSCSSDGSVALWDPESRQKLGHFLGHQSAVSAVVAVVRRQWRAQWGSVGRPRGLWDCMRWESNPKSKRVYKE